MVTAAKKRSSTRAIAELLGVSSGRVASLFRCMDIAEEEITKVWPRDANGKPTDPSPITLAPSLFRACLPPQDFVDKHEGLYRHHVRELVQRSKTKSASYAVATEAEVLVGILAASQLAPLTHDGMVLAEPLFESVMGSKFGVHTAEQWAGQYDELLAEARRKVKTGRA